MTTSKTIFAVALFLGLPLAGHGQDGISGRAPPVIIEIVGGFGHLTSLELKADGTFTWLGWEPGRRVASIRQGTLDASELKSIVGLADRVRRTASGNNVAGGDRSYTLVLRSRDGQRREFKIRCAKDDQRPKELRELLNSLWATRSRQEK
jgi:hypothetical protein